MDEPSVPLVNVVLLPGVSLGLEESPLRRVVSTKFDLAGCVPAGTMGYQQKIHHLPRLQATALLF